MRPATGIASDSTADFFHREPVANFGVDAGCDVNQGDFPMTFMAPFAQRLSVVAAYAAFALVGAIVLGIF
jgi:hypothetical protein